MWFWGEKKRTKVMGGGRYCAIDCNRGSWCPSAATSRCWCKRPFGRGLIADGPISSWVRSADVAQVGESKDAYHGATDAVINLYSMDSAVDVSDVAEIWNGNRYFVGQLHL